MVWLVLTAVVFLALAAGKLSSNWSAHRAALRRLRRLPARKRNRTRVYRFSFFDGGPTGGGFYGGDGDSGDGGGGDGGCD